MKFINKYQSKNYDLRDNKSDIKYIILHYTAMKSDIEAINHLCDKNNKVSAHFVVSKSGTIYNLVDMNFRAWHAGLSSWKKEKDINSYSIGIELDNSGHHLKFENYKKK